MRILLVLAPLAFAVLGGAAAAEPLIKIGVSAPLSGSASTYGSDIRKAVEFAAEYYGKGRYQLLIEDDQCDGRTAVTAAQKLTRVDKVRYVLGFACSGALLAAAPVYNQAKAVAIGVYTSSPRLSQAGPYIFRTVPSDTFAAPPLIKHFAGRYRRVAGIFEETEFCQDFRRALEAANQPAEFVLTSESYLPKTADFRALLLKLRSTNPEALVLITQAEPELALLVRQIRALEWRIPIFSHVYPSSPAFLSAAGKDAEGILFTDLPPRADAISPEGRRMFELFEARYGALQSGDMTFVSTLAAFYALHQAIQSGVDVREYLHSHEFSSVLGRYRFDEHGDIQGLGFVMKVIRGGRPEMAAE